MGTAHAFKGGQGPGGPGVDRRGAEGQVRPGEMREDQKDAFMKKVKLIYRFQEELGITDEQLESLKTIKNTVKKDIIMKKAEIEVISVDIKAALEVDDIDVTAVNALIDKKYEIKKAKAKITVEALAKLKNVLTPAQKDKLKMLIKERKDCPKMEKGRRGAHEGFMLESGRPEGCPMQQKE